MTQLVNLIINNGPFYVRLYVGTSSCRKEINFFSCKGTLRRHVAGCSMDGVSCETLIFMERSRFDKLSGIFNSFLNCWVTSSSKFFAEVFATASLHFAVTKYFLGKLSVMESPLKRLSVRCSFSGNWLVMDSSAGSLSAARNFIMTMMKIEVESCQVFAKLFKHSFFAILDIDEKVKNRFWKENFPSTAKWLQDKWGMGRKMSPRQMIWDFHYWVQVGSGRQKELNRQLVTVTLAES